jgi:hypothetical protein
MVETATVKSLPDDPHRYRRQPKAISHWQSSLSCDSTIEPPSRHTGTNQQIHQVLRRQGPLICGLRSCGVNLIVLFSDLGRIRAVSQ